jgi:hypothetical protein
MGFLGVVARRTAAPGAVGELWLSSKEKGRHWLPSFGHLLVVACVGI